MLKFDYTQPEDLALIPIFAVYRKFFTRQITAKKIMALLFEK